MKCETELEELSEIRQFLGRLISSSGRLAGFFEAQQPVGIARAPGRLDVMGGIADYSGSLVLELPLREAAFVVAQLHSEPIVRTASVSMEDSENVREASFPAAVILGEAGTGLTYESVHDVFKDRPKDIWAAYVAGTLAAAVREGWIHSQPGARILVISRVPEGCGVSSSAAIEVAALFALSAVAVVKNLGVPFPNHEAALLCQRVENLTVGAPCGVMDQMTSAYGKRGQLLELLCHKLRSSDP